MKLQARFWVWLALMLMASPLAAQSFQLGETLPQAKSAPGAASAQPYRELVWDDLLPDDWDPEGELGDIDWEAFDDADPRATAALQHLQTVWAAAPAVKTLEGQRVKLAGFVVPLESKGDEIHEFLLVPYFGACIHSPPPPANQIVHVVAARLPASFEVMDPFWISGEMQLVKSDTELGTSGYRLIAAEVEPFELP